MDTRVPQPRPCGEGHSPAGPPTWVKVMGSTGGESLLKPCTCVPGQEDRGSTGRTQAQCNGQQDQSEGVRMRPVNLQGYVPRGTQLSYEQPLCGSAEGPGEAVARGSRWSTPQYCWMQDCPAGVDCLCPVAVAIQFEPLARPRGTGLRSQHWRPRQEDCKCEASPGSLLT